MIFTYINDDCLLFHVYREVNFGQSILVCLSPVRLTCVTHLYMLHLYLFKLTFIGSYMMSTCNRT